MYTLRWLRLAALGALSLSAAAAMDLVLESPTFCGVGGGCDAVKQSAAGQSLGQYLPALGLLGFSSIFWGSLIPIMKVRKAALYASIAAGIGGAALIALQWLSVGTFCPLCLGADGFAILVAVLALLGWRRAQPTGTTWPMSAWAALFVIAAGLPPAYAIARPVPMPRYVTSRLTDAIDVIEVSDFQCPYCRSLHESLAPLLAEHKDEIHFVRLPFPLAGHPHSVRAARAYVCASAQGKGEAMADFLFTATDLSLENIQKQADALGIERASFDACHTSANTLQGIMSVREALPKQGVRGVPVVWIEGRQLAGYDKDKGDAPYREALQDALSGRPVTLRPLPFVVLGLIVAILVALSARSKKES